ncbi:hypothetical protein [Absicoccus porci]|nr:hypothetical protein [Absicoccus porci]
MKKTEKKQLFWGIQIFKNSKEFLCDITNQRGSSNSFSYLKVACDIFA